MKLILVLGAAFALTNCSSPVVQKITASEAVQNKVLQLCQYQSALGSIETLLAILYPVASSVIEEGQGERVAGMICDAVARAKLNKRAITLPSIKVKVEIDTGESKIVPIEGKIVAPSLEVPPPEDPAKLVEVEKLKE